MSKAEKLRHLANELKGAYDQANWEATEAEIFNDLLSHFTWSSLNFYGASWSLTGSTETSKGRQIVKKIEDCSWSERQLLAVKEKFKKSFGIGLDLRRNSHSTYSPPKYLHVSGVSHEVAAFLINPLVQFDSDKLKKQLNIRQQEIVAENAALATLTSWC